MTGLTNTSLTASFYEQWQYQKHLCGLDSSKGLIRTVLYNVVALVGAVLRTLFVCEVPQTFLFMQCQRESTVKGQSLSERKSFQCTAINGSNLLTRQDIETAIMNQQFDLLLEPFQLTDVDKLKVINFFIKFCRLLENKVSNQAINSSAQLISDMLQDPQFAKSAVNSIDLADSHCGDGSAMAVNDIYLQYELKKCQEAVLNGDADELSLRQHALLFLKHDLLNQYFQKSILPELQNRQGERKDLDPLENKMALDVALNNRLRLELQCTEIQNGVYSRITQQDIGDAEKFVNEHTTAKHVDEFLQQWAPYQMWQRKVAWEESKFATTPYEPVAGIDLACCITYETLTPPDAELKPGEKRFVVSDFVTWNHMIYCQTTLKRIYIEYETDPYTKHKIELSQVEQLVEETPATHEILQV